MKKPFVVIQSNKKETEDAYITKLQRITEVTDKFFGVKEKKETFYIKGTKQLEVGVEIPAEHVEANYNVVEHASEMPDENNVGQTIKMNLKWLHLK